METRDQFSNMKYRRYDLSVVSFYCSYINNKKAARKQRQSQMQCWNEHVWDEYFQGN